MTVKPVWKHVEVLCLGLFLACPLGLLTDARGQEVPYSSEEYEEYQSAVNSATAKREGEIVNFIKKNPKSALVQHAVGSYVKLLADYENRGQVDKVLSAGEKLLSVQPDEINTLNMTAIAAYQKQQFNKAVRYGEKVYAKKPSSGLAFVLANSHGQLKNEAKYVRYGEKACAEIAPKDCYAILGELTRVFAAKTQWSKAANYAQKAIAGFDAAKKPGQARQKDWDDYVKRQKAVAYAVVGRHNAERRRWGATVTNYSKVLNLYSNPPLNAEAYYYVGMGRWKQNRIDAAMAAFAKGSVQRGAPHAKPCRQYLETLYKSTHNDSLAGIEEFVTRTGGRRR